MGRIKNLALRAHANMERGVQYFEPRFLPLGLVAVAGFPLYYLVWHYLFPQPYENLPLRLFGSFLCLPVMLAKYWPERLRRYLPVYWHMAVLFALPFFFTFMLLKNNGNSVWLLSALTAAFMMVLLLDWLNLFIQFVLGTGFAWLAYVLTTEAPHIGVVSLEHVPVYLFVIAIGAVANYSAEVVKRERLRAMMAAASTVAHELRTPLLSIKAGAAGLKQHLPPLLQAYRMAREAGLPVEAVREAHLDSMRGVLERFEAEVDYSNIAIDMLLMNTKPFGFKEEAFADCSMAACVDIALRRYPFASERERGLVAWEEGEDFNFRGSELLMVHVLFNLLKNAVYHVAKAGKGRISIRLETLPEGGRLVFRDTGPGIPARVLPHVFTRFYSWSWGHDDGSGAGIGLAYCRSVMEAFGGSITCKSIEGEFSEFVLTFPAASA
ncbi:MAG: HAMP domain-containing sensor histidine kinase [Sulfurimicrobium sp.]|nr:HAMP domain-containing sensor histidine kinase [Sulfurimicrobium sp.]MDP1706016.1 HAMP domain-containing sensor histidine kinase [Sulfurimicrobium sp.]MDP1897117.1 HAMP domain-containing sensor histidine kinase [Sulfurimicrobium sp.]MDP2197776.1 HAMP domain-containing sensor histidine kinase [Sulfurimicrobium sp.]MDP2962412.1 HAMP domain-containing sensor histidine kinase [Sulfurimicrobium sp.]